MADMWSDLSEWENYHHGQVFMVITTEEVREDLRDYNAFDTDCDEFICDIDEVSEAIVWDALKHAYNTIDYHYGINYEVINDSCYDYIVEKLSSKTTGWGKGQIYNAETKTFESYQDFLARIKEDRHAS